tara:strand:- start:908 stop:1276 length:369 start_codon:yes stop_codon:yes gene_type:complete
MNRKKRANNVRFGPALKAVFICLITCSLGLGYVWQKQQINTLGQQIKERELVLEKLKRENKRRGDNLAYLMSPQQLDFRLRQLKLNLIVPLPKQIVVLKEPREEVAVKLTGSNTQFFYAQDR